MQTIIGSGGAIGQDLARQLSRYTNKIRLVSRQPKAINATDEVLALDITSKEAVYEAVKGSEIVYLTVGFAYSLKVWKQQWPAMMENIIAACREYGAKLVFFDNIYMYDCNRLSAMTEETPVNPCSRKGEIRARIAQRLTDEYNKGNLQALIARSADFYGPTFSNSVMLEMVYKNFKKGKKANWLINADKIHHFTYTPDAAKAVALLGNTAEAYNQVWHMPTSTEALTGRQWIKLFADAMQVEARFSTISKWQLSLLGIFIPVLGEMKEMAYQYDRDYCFDSSKFDQKFGLKATPPREAIQQIVAAGVNM
jgi:nucleoside-diphosphate-sugar epimerase